MTGLSYLAVRAVIDLFDAGDWAAIRPACRGRSKDDGRVLSQNRSPVIKLGEGSAPRYSRSQTFFWHSMQ
jgi:hypothetical protein